MDNDEQFLSQVLAGIAEAEIITIFFPLLRRAILIDTRYAEGTGQLVRVVPQVSSMEERIAMIEKMRPEFGKVRSILGIPWLKSVAGLSDRGVTDQLVKRLHDAGMDQAAARRAVDRAIQKLMQVERSAFLAMIRGQGYKTLWSASAK